MAHRLHVHPARPVVVRTGRIACRLRERSHIAAPDVAVAVEREVGHENRLHGVSPHV
ncbi:hypothetical protein [Streptomyces graminofaciens]|uniref:hypothetical protein n=1 Tax=Streptomyces graminofaciens TaxID=68212 RepID=UPI002572D79F|nr:hypothetical protein [Streptomyces graminofaciens]